MSEKGISGWLFIMIQSDKPEMHGALFTIRGGNGFTENNQTVWTRFRRCRDTCRLVLIAIPERLCIKCWCNNERLNKCRFGSCDMGCIIKFCLPLSTERGKERERKNRSACTIHARLVKLAPSFDDSHPAPCYFLTLLRHCPRTAAPFTEFRLHRRRIRRPHKDRPTAGWRTRWRQCFYCGHL